MTTPIRLDEASADIPTLENQSQRTLERVSDCLTHILEALDKFLDHEKENVPIREYGLLTAISKDINCLVVLINEGEDAYNRCKLRSLAETMLDSLLDPLGEMKDRFELFKKEKEKKEKEKREKQKKKDKEAVECRTQ